MITISTTITRTTPAATIPNNASLPPPEPEPPAAAGADDAVAGEPNGLTVTVGTSLVSASSTRTVPKPVYWSRPAGGWSLAVATNRSMTLAASRFGNFARISATVPETIAA